MLSMPEQQVDTYPARLVEKPVALCPISATGNSRPKRIRPVREEQSRCFNSEDTL
jgi:hypothetical protein